MRRIQKNNSKNFRAHFRKEITIWQNSGYSTTIFCIPSFFNTQQIVGYLGSETPFLCCGEFLVSLRRHLQELPGYPKCYNRFIWMKIVDSQGRLGWIVGRPNSNIPPAQFDDDAVSNVVDDFIMKLKNNDIGALTDYDFC